MINKKKAGRPVGTTGKARAITDKELNAVIAVTESSRHAVRNIAMLVLSNYLGLRAKEISLLKVSDVYDAKANVTVKTLRLYAHYTKGGTTSREISLEHKRVTAALERYIFYRQKTDGVAFNVQAPLFRSQRGKSFSPNAVARLFINLYSEAGIEHASSHTGRRSLITRLSESGVDLFSIAQIAGHRNISTTMTYISANPSRLRNILMNI
ncbi:MAG: site-specific integrase [Methylococcaceae bacterium]